MAATIIARYLDADAVAMARNIALVLTGLGIAVTQLIALLGGQAARLIVGGWQARPARATPVKTSRRQGPKGGTNALNAAQPEGTVVPFDAARRSVKSWLDRPRIRAARYAAAMRSKPTAAMAARWPRL